MGGIRVDPCLKLAGVGRMQLPATVDKPLLNVGYLRDVERDRNRILVRENQMELLVPMCLQQVLKYANFQIIFFL